MESWRSVWRRGLLPQFSDEQLSILRDALLNDDPRLVQGSTTVPPPLLCVADWPVEAADAIGYCGWVGLGLATIGEVEEYFARCCFECDVLTGETASCRWFLNVWDDTPRDAMRRELAAEIEANLRDRESQRSCTAEAA